MRLISTFFLLILFSSSPLAVGAITLGSFQWPGHDVQNKSDEKRGLPVGGGTVPTLTSVIGSIINGGGGGTTSSSSSSSSAAATTSHGTTSSAPATTSSPVTSSAPATTSSAATTSTPAAAATSFAAATTSAAATSSVASIGSSSVANVVAGAAGGVVGGATGVASAAGGIAGGVANSVSVVVNPTGSTIVGVSVSNTASVTATASGSASASASGSAGVTINVGGIVSHVGSVASSVAPASLVSEVLSAVSSVAPTSIASQLVSVANSVVPTSVVSDVVSVVSSVVSVAPTSVISQMVSGANSVAPTYAISEVVSGLNSLAPTSVVSQVVSDVVSVTNSVAPTSIDSQFISNVAGATNIQPTSLLSPIGSDINSVVPTSSPEADAIISAAVLASASISANIAASVAASGSVSFAAEPFASQISQNTVHALGITSPIQITLPVLDARVTAGACFRLSAAANVQELDVGGILTGTVHLAAGTCLCVNAAGGVGVGGGGVGAGLTVEVDSSTGAVFTGLTAINLANALEFPGSYQTVANLFGLATADQCVVAAITLAHSSPAYQAGVGGCCKRQCDSGYTADSSGACVPSTPTCDSTQILCDGSCYDKDQYACKSGMPTQTAGFHQRRGLVCPGGRENCPIWSGSKSKMMYECIDTENDVESCGGCVSPDSPSQSIGEDCTSIPNINRVGCIEGKCTIFSCRKGWKLVGGGWNASCQAVESAYGAGTSGRRKKKQSVGGSQR